jgi:hypothetical protein
VAKAVPGGTRDLHLRGSAGFRALDDVGHRAQRRRLHANDARGLSASMAVMLPTAFCAGMTLPLATLALTRRG